MPNKCFQLRQPVPAVSSAQDKWQMLTVPQGAVVSMAEEPQGAGPFVNVTWEGRAVAIYARDLMEHGALVKTGVG